MLDRNKIYGYSTEQIEQMDDYPKDNFETIYTNDNTIFDVEDIKRMFPEQRIILVNCTFDGRAENSHHVVTASVYAYHCNRADICKIIESRGFKKDDILFNTMSYSCYGGTGLCMLT